MSTAKRLQDLKKGLARVQGQADELTARLKGDIAELATNKDDQTAATEARAIAQQVAEAVQQSASQQVAGVVTKCLEAVFDDPYEFQIIFEQKRGRTEARLVFARGDHLLDPLGAAGGGVVDVAAFALRLACLALSTPRRRRLVVMDEPFRFVSKQYRPKLRDMLTTLATDMGFQFIFVTHIPELAVGHVIEIE